MKNVQISAQGEEVVNRLLESGRCSTADEVVEVSLQLLDKQEEKLKALRADLQLGMSDIRNGDVAPLDMETIKKAARERFEQQNSHG